MRTLLLIINQPREVPSREPLAGVYSGLQCSNTFGIKNFSHITKTRRTRRKFMIAVEPDLNGILAHFQVLEMP